MLNTYKSAILNLTNKSGQDRVEGNPESEAVGNEVTTQFSLWTTGKWLTLESIMTYAPIFGVTSATWLHGTEHATKPRKRGAEVLRKGIYQITS